MSVIQALTSGDLRLSALPCLLVGITVSLTRAVEAQCQVQEVVSPTDCASTFYPCYMGTAIAVEDDWLAVGGLTLNRVLLYQKSATSWVFRQSLDSTTFGQHGWAVEMQGQELFVSDILNGAGGLNSAGRVTVYTLIGGSWTKAQVLFASDASIGDHFGADISCEGDTLMVGAPMDLDLAVGPGQGSIYLFERVGGSWKESGKLRASDGQADDMFGMAIEVSDDWLVVGATGAAGATSDSGAAYLFRRQIGAWNEVQKLVAPSGNSGDVFGLAVALDADSGDLLVGAPVSDWQVEDGGVVHAWRESASLWHYDQVIVPLDPAKGQKFGFGIALEGNRALIAAPSAPEPFPDSGAAYLFARDSAGWQSASKLIAIHAHAGDGVGWGGGVALSNDRAFVGAPGLDEVCSGMNPNCDGGGAYVFSLCLTATAYCFCPTGLCGNGDTYGGCASSTGSGAILQACGSSSVLLDDLLLESRWMPTNVRAMVVMGASAGEIPFGDGTLCVGAGSRGLYRFPSKESGNRGAVLLGPGIVAYASGAFPVAGQVQPGETWYFQTWYRDPNGPCGTGFNLTNGLKVEFTP